MAKESANNGFIKINRSLLDWEHITEPVVLQVFIYLLLKVNHKAKWHNGKMCERGATFVSIRTMCDDLAMSPHTAIKALRTLEDSGEVVRTQVTQKLSKTKLVNYSKYQDFNLVSVAKSATQSATQSATKQERKERKEIDVVEINSAHAHEKIVNDMFATGIAIERFCMTEGITVDQCRELADDALAEWAIIGETHKTEKEVKKHILERIRKKVQSMRERGVLLGSIPEDVRLKRINADCEALIAEGAERKMVIKFYKYYTQKSNDGSGRMIFETLSGWDTKTRYVEFLNREKK